MNGILHSVPMSDAGRIAIIEMRMLYLKDIVSITYDSELQRLTVVFDTCRKVVFYAVPPEVCERLVNSSWPKEGYEAHVLGKFAWTEIGALGPDELHRVG
jgi:hypothetical protein